MALRVPLKPPQPLHERNEEARSAMGQENSVLNREYCQSRSTDSIFDESGWSLPLSWIFVVLIIAFVVLIVMLVT
jgi:hypothetical protein